MTKFQNKKNQSKKRNAVKRGTVMGTRIIEDKTYAEVVNDHNLALDSIVDLLDDMYNQAVDMNEEQLNKYLDVLQKVKNLID